LAEGQAIWRLDKVDAALGQRLLGFVEHRFTVCACHPTPFRHSVNTDRPNRYGSRIECHRGCGHLARLFPLLEFNNPKSW
jgi:hypothetical protein